MSILDSLGFPIINKIMVSIYEYRGSRVFYWYIDRINLNQWNC